MNSVLSFQFVGVVGKAKQMHIRWYVDLPWRGFTNVSCRTASSGCGQRVRESFITKLMIVYQEELGDLFRCYIILICFSTSYFSPSFQS